MADSVFKGDLLAETNRQFPFMKNNNVGVKINHNRPGSFGYLEAYGPGETGRPVGYNGPDDPGQLRPKEFPIDGSGIEVYSPEVTPSDLAGDVFTHTDQVGERMSGDLAATITDGQKEEMNRQYLDYSHTINNPNRPDREEAALANGTDSMMRTSVFNQGGPNAVRGLERFNLNVEQQNIMNNADQYVRTGKDPGRSMFTLRGALGL